MTRGAGFAAFASWLLLAAGVAIATPVVPAALVRSPEEIGSLSIGVSDRGDAVASWSVSPYGRAIVRVAHKRAGRSRWVISQPLDEGASQRLAVDGRGDAVAVWTSNPGALGPGAVPSLLKAAVRPAALGHWRAPTVIARLQPCDGCEALPSVAIGVSGEVLIVWSEGSEEAPDTPLAVEPDEIIQAVRGSALTGRFGPPSALSRETDFAHAPQAALDGRGDAVVVWEAALRATTVFEGRAIQAAWRPSGDGWHQPITLGRGDEGLGNPQVALSERGRAVAVWERGPDYPMSGSPAASVVESAFGSASGANWGAAQPLSSPGESARNIQLASAPTGSIFAVWERDMPTSNAVVAVRGSTASGAWEAEATVATWGHVAPPVRMCPRGAKCRLVRQLPVAAPRVAMNARGDAAMVWEQAGAYHPFVRAARWSGRGWLEPVRVSAPGASEARVALDGFDDALVIWQAVGPRAVTVLDSAKLPRASG